MTQYQAKSISSLSFEVTKGDEPIGKLLYKSWFKFDAVIEMANGSSFQVEPKGFWGTTIELRDGENVLLTFTMNWSGDIVLQTYFNGLEEGYVFKHRGIFREFFILTDPEGTELLVMKPHVKWSKMNYEYQIATSGTFEALTDKEVLLMGSLHCANYYMSMVAATM